MSDELDMTDQPELFDHTDDDPAKTGGLEDETYTGPLSGAAIPVEISEENKTIERRGVVPCQNQ